MVYSFLCKDEKKHAEISTYFCLKRRCGKKSAIFRTVYPNRNHVTTHPDGLKWQEMHNIHLLYNKTITDLCFGRHGVLLNSKLKETKSTTMNIFRNFIIPF